MIFPEKWQIKTIDDIHRGFFDGPHATPTPSDDGPIFLGIKNITDSGHLDLSDIKHISESEYPKWTKRVTPKFGDIVFTYEATLNRYAIIPRGFRGCLGRRIALIRPNKNVIDTKYLFYYFFGNEWRRIVSENTISGATVDRIPLIKFPSFPILVPPLPTQKKIAAVLSAYDDLIENNARRIALLERMSEELYKEWFVRMRFPGHEKTRFVKGIPEGWLSDNLKLGDITVVVDCEHKTAPIQDEGIPSIRTPNVGKGYLQLDGVRRVSEETYHKWTRRAKPEYPDLILAREAPVGNVALLPKGLKVCLGQRTVLIRPDTNLISPEFLNFLLNSMNAYLVLLSTGATVGHLNVDDIRKLKLPFLPPLSLQNQFSTILEKTNSLIYNVTNKNQLLRQTRDRLLTRLISGKLSVEDRDIAFPRSMLEDEIVQAPLAQKTLEPIS